MNQNSKNALVTGASKGVGRGIAVGLAKDGWNVGVNYYKDQAGAEATAETIQSLGQQAWVLPADVGYSDQVETMFKQFIELAGRIDLLVNNAGVQTWVPFIDLKESDWDRTIRTNLKGTFLCTQQAARLMKETGGRIINIGSGANTINCIAPGTIEIERTKLEDLDYAGEWGSRTPMGRIGHVEDVADAVVFFAGERAKFITGQTLYVDGGLWSQVPWIYDF